MFEGILLTTVVEPLVAMIAKAAVGAIKKALSTKSEENPGGMLSAIDDASDNEDTEALMEEINKCLRK